MKTYTVTLSKDQINRLKDMLESEISGYHKMGEAEFSEDIDECGKILKALNKKSAIK